MHKLALIVCLACTGFAQTEPPGDSHASSPVVSAKPSEPASDQSDANKQEEKKPEEKKKERRGALVGGPIPISSPALGSGVILMGGYIFPLSRKDKVSPPSLVGAAALFTDNGSRGLLVGTKLYFDQDRYHAFAAFVRADLNYDFYGLGNEAGDAGRKFGLKQNVDGYLVEGTRRLFWRFFLGPRMLFATTTIAPQKTGELPPGLPPLNVDLRIRSLGFKVERDTTPNRFYPLSGTSSEMTGDFFDSALGSSFTFQSYRLTFNSYHSLTPKQVLAYNAHVCVTEGEAPFFGQCIFGTKNELRGYTAGRYIDRMMLATQLEYRRVLPWRFGMVAFAGVGEVGPSFWSFNASNLLPSIGLGPRFQISTKYHVNLRADFAWGKNGSTFSMGLAEAF